MQLAVYAAIRAALEKDTPVAVATIVRGENLGRQVVLTADGRHVGSLGASALDAEIMRRALALLSTFQCERVTLDQAPIEVFIECHGPRPTLVIVGAVHVAITLVQLARVLGFRTVVVDPRGAFATRERFPDVDDLLVEWPAEAFERVRLNEATSLAVLSHDMKIDVPALVHGLRSRVPYIGALGSRTTQAKRAAALRAEGVSAEDIERIHSPIGLDLGGRRAQETALSIMAEIVAVSHGIGSRFTVSSSGD